MKWVEIIHLCIVKNDMKKLYDEIVGQIKSTNKDNEPYKIKLYNHSRLDTDMSIHIYWEEEHPDRLESTLGMTLTQMLKEYGMIHYSVWVEAD